MQKIKKILIFLSIFLMLIVPVFSFVQAATITWGNPIVTEKAVTVSVSGLDSSKKYRFVLSKSGAGIIDSKFLLPGGNPAYSYWNLNPGQNYNLNLQIVDPSSGLPTASGAPTVTFKTLPEGGGTGNNGTTQTSPSGSSSNGTTQTSPSGPCEGKICDPLGNRFSSTGIPGLIQAILEGIIKIGIPIVALAIVYCGFLFVFARGNSEKLTKAKDALLYTLIGAAVLLGSWAIAKLISATVLAL